MKKILLIGMPGSGKTTIGRIIAKKLKKDFIDFDEYIFRVTGKDSAEHLAELGDEKFLDFEAEIAERINGDNLVIASSGSVPLQRRGINHLRKNAKTVWIDVPLEIIKNRVKQRADGNTRIVGAQTMTFEEILQYRLKKYQQNHDIHVSLKKEMTPEKVADLILKKLI